MSDAITFEIQEHFGVLESFPTGWNKEINLVSWNGNPAKFDIRDWSADHTHMSKGITLSRKQMSILIDVMSDEFTTGF